MKRKILIIGGGLSGLTIARLFKDNGDYVEIHEKDSKLGGLCIDHWSKKSQCWVNKNGPHILNFGKETEEALSFIKKYCKLKEYNHKVVCLGDSSFTFWPMNKTYLNLFKILNPNKDVMKEFVSSYSQKMWKSDYPEVVKNILDRYKLKNNNNSDFFENRKTFVISNGFKTLFKNLSKNIKIVSNSYHNNQTIQNKEFDIIIATSPIDEFFNYRFGKLNYRGIDFIFKQIINDGEKILLTPVMNLNTHKKITRITEYNQFIDKKSKNRILCFEIPSDNNKCYPIMTQKNKDILKKYQDYIKKFSNIYFLGRLGEFKYYDMDDAIQNSINLFKKLK